MVDQGASCNLSELLGLLCGFIEDVIWSASQPLDGERTRKVPAKATQIKYNENND